MGKGKFRNYKCHCGSGKKWKYCHLRDDQIIEQTGKKVIINRK